MHAATIAGDASLAGVGVLAAALLTPVATTTDAFRIVIAVAVTWPLLQWLRGSYSTRALGGRDEYSRVGRTMVELIALLAVAAAVLSLNVPIGAVGIVLGVAASGSAVLRYALRRVLRAFRRQGKAVRRVLAVGTGHGVSSFVDQLSTNVDHDIVVVGACAEGPGNVVEDVPTVGRMPDARVGEDPISDDSAVDAVVRAAHGLNADTVTVTSCSQFTGDRMRALGWALADEGISLVSVSGLVEVARHRIGFGRAGGVALVHVHPVRVAGVPGMIKHTLDKVFAALGLVVLLPVILLIAAAVRLGDRGPAFYRSTRFGQGAQPFTMLKFRTMSVDSDARRDDLTDDNEHDGHMFKMREDPRITRVGRFLRKYSLDELPQLVNVLQGQMSLVGPRPPLPDEVAGYDHVELRRLMVRPGMTGLWQVSGRSDLSWEETIRLDLRYVDNWSLMLDANLLWRTCHAVIRGNGAY
jgi:exopolysaccharide biosynthesis polyprenyl glycosylphosphotransferase